MTNSENYSGIICFSFVIYNNDDLRYNYLWLMIRRKDQLSPLAFHWKSSETGQFCVTGP